MTTKQAIIEDRIISSARKLLQRVDHNPKRYYRLNGELAPKVKESLDTMARQFEQLASVSNSRTVNSNKPRGN